MSPNTERITEDQSQNTSVVTNFDQIRDRATIICGIPKSGTTLLLALLDDHPQLTVFPEEMQFFMKVYGRNEPVERFLTRSDFKLLQLNEVGSSSDTRDYSDVSFAQLEEEIRALGHKTKNFKDLLTGVVGVWHKVQHAQSDEKIRWVEKTPYNEKYLYIYNQWFHENAIYLHLIRDPRDNFATYKRKHPHYTLDQFALQWALSCKIGFWAQKHLTNYHFIRYEDLVMTPEREMQKICEFLKVRYVESLLYPTRNGRFWKGNSMYNTSFTSISSQSVGRYKDHLQQGEIEFLEERLQAFMREFGYDLYTRTLQHSSSEFVSKLKREFLKWHVFGRVYQYPKIYKILRSLMRISENRGRDRREKGK